MNTKTAILLFARSASIASKDKQLLRDAADNARLLAAMTVRTQQMLERCGLAVFHFDESQQQGATFGQRLANAVETVFQKGYQSLIVVGNDCPELSIFHLRSAAQQLAKGRSSLGIDQRAGAYLIGLQAASFDMAAFASLPWQTSELAQALAYQLARNTSLQLLPKLADLNQAADLWALPTYLKGVRGLAAFLSANTPKPFFGSMPATFSPSCLLVAALPHRGPPSSTARCLVA